MDLLVLHCPESKALSSSAKLSNNFSFPNPCTPTFTPTHLHSSRQAWRLTLANRTSNLDSKKPRPNLVFKMNSSSKVANVETDTSPKVANSPPPTDLASRWPEIQGSTYWEGMLDPLDGTLREEILRYGEFTQATYDNFDSDEYSKYRGSARYNKAKMLAKAGLPKTGYEVTKNFYATANVKSPLFFLRPEAEDPWSKDSNWMGYVAVSTDEETIKRLGRRDIVISWRGTIRHTEWAANFKQNLAPAAMDVRTKGMAEDRGKTRIEDGFLSMYISTNKKSRYNKTSARTQVLTELRRLLQEYKDEELSITVTGHSLGSALATINAYDIAQSGINRLDQNTPIPTEWDHPTAEPSHPSKEGTIPVTVFSFAGPRVGNDAFRDRLYDLGVKVLRMVNVNDLVPRVPGLLLNESLTFLQDIIDKLPFTYTHVGVELKLNNLDSPYLDRNKASKPNCHNLEQYLHLVDGHQGDGKTFALTTPRQVVLINKSCDFLYNHPYVPHTWWQMANKGLTRNESGEWVQPEREPEDVPSSSDVLMSGGVL